MPSRSEDITHTDTGPLEIDGPWKVRAVQFRRVDGVVLSVREKTDARVFGSGGTHVSATYDSPVYSSEIDTEFTRYTEFWIRENNGTEVHFRIVNWDVPLRKGQHVSVLIGSSKKRSCIAAICNQSSERLYINELAHSILHKNSIISMPLRALGYLIVFEAAMIVLILFGTAIYNIFDILIFIISLIMIIPALGVLFLGSKLVAIADSRHQEVIDKIKLLAEAMWQDTRDT